MPGGFDDDEDVLEEVIQSSSPESYIHETLAMHGKLIYQEFLEGDKTETYNLEFKHSPIVSDLEELSGSFQNFYDFSYFSAHSIGYGPTIQTETIETTEKVNIHLDDDNNIEISNFSENERRPQRLSFSAGDNAA